jgi:hypothetical protein
MLVSRRVERTAIVNRAQENGEKVGKLFHAIVLAGSSLTVACSAKNVLPVDAAAEISARDSASEDTRVSDATTARDTLPGFDLKLAPADAGADGEECACRHPDGGCYPCYI